MGRRFWWARKIWNDAEENWNYRCTYRSFFNALLSGLKLFWQKIKKDGGLSLRPDRIKPNQLVGLRTIIIDHATGCAAVPIVTDITIEQDVTRAGCGEHVTMGANFSDRGAAVGAATQGGPTCWHSPGDETPHGTTLIRGRGIVVRGMEITHEREPEAVDVHTVMRALRIVGIGSAAADHDVAEFVDEVMVADIAPSIVIHVVILSRANLGKRFRSAGRAVIAGTGGVMEHSASEAGHISQTTLRGARIPTGTAIIRIIVFRVRCFTGSGEAG